MGKADAVQPAPAVVVLIGRATEGVRVPARGEIVEGVAKRLEQHHVTPFLRGQAGGLREEVEARCADPGEGILGEQVLEAAELKRYLPSGPAFRTPMARTARTIVFSRAWARHTL